MNTLSPLLCAVLLLGLFCLPRAGLAQPFIEWDWTYGGNNYEECQALLVTPTGYLLGGMTASDAGNEVGTGAWGFPDFWVLHTNMAGELEWDARFGCDGTEIMWDMTETTDGGFLLVGYSNSDACPNMKTENSRGEEDIWVIKIDANGNKIWDKIYGGEGEDRARKIVPLSDGSFLLGGWSSSNASVYKEENSRGETDFWIVKIDADGNKIWDKTFGGPLRDQLFDMIELSNGQILLGGWSESNIGGEKSENSRGLNDFWIIQMTQDGDFIKDYTYGGDGEESIQFMLESKDGSILVLGQSGSAKNTGERTEDHYGDWDYWLLRLDFDSNNDLEIKKERAFGGSGREVPLTLYENLTGKVWILGVSHSPADGNKESPLLGINDYWLFQLDRNLEERVWETTWGGSDIELPTHIEPAHGGGYVIAGISSSNISQYKSHDSRGFNDFWFIKTGCSLEGDNVLHQQIACENVASEITLTPLICDDCLVEWENGSTEFTRTEILSSDTIYTVYIIHEDACEKEGMIAVEITENPLLFEAIAQDPQCFGDTNGQIDISGVSSGTAPFEFALNDGNYTPSAVFTGLGEGEYHLAVRDALGCMDDTLFTLKEPLPIAVELGDNQFIELGEIVELDAYILYPIDSLSWNNPEELSCADCLNPTTIPTETTTYQITVYNENGCFERDAMTVSVRKDNLFYAPNIFSPNDDGINDFFEIYISTGVAQIKLLQVFDRWGEPVFEASEILPNQQHWGWDGRHKDKKGGIGVYVWWAELEYIDGRTEIVKGDLTLIR